MNKVIFFDVDDTLLDTSAFAETARRAAIDLMVDNGLPMEKDEAYYALKAIIKEKGSNYDKHFNELCKQVISREDPLLIAMGMTTYHNVKFSLLKPFPKTNDMLIYLKSEGYRLGVISNGITIKQWEKLIRLNLYPFFEQVITSEEVGHKKPEKQIYEEAIHRMRTRADDAVMIGNKFKEDALGAVNAGMSAILVNSNITESEREFIKRERLDIKVVDHIGQINRLL